MERGQFDGVPSNQVFSDCPCSSMSYWRCWLLDQASCIHFSVLKEWSESREESEFGMMPRQRLWCSLSSLSVPPTKSALAEEISETLSDSSRKACGAGDCCRRPNLSAILWTKGRPWPFRSGSSKCHPSCFCNISYNTWIVFIRTCCVFSRVSGYLNWSVRFLVK